MKEILGNILAVSRGLHISKDEKNPINLQNENISKAYILNYDDVQDYIYNAKSTLNLKLDKKTEVYVNLDKRYKNSIPQNFDIVIPQRSFYFKPRLICFDENVKFNYVYSNDVIFIRSISDKIDINFAMYLLRTQKVRDVINNPLEKRSRRITLENLRIELPDIKTQRKITKDIQRAQMTFEGLII